jgi:hypothetical protein
LLNRKSLQILSDRGNNDPINVSSLEGNWLKHSDFWDTVTGLILNGFTSGTDIVWIYLLCGKAKLIGEY